MELFTPSPTFTNMPDGTKDSQFPEIEGRVVKRLAAS
jgi:hypothetical protein